MIIIAGGPRNYVPPCPAGEAPILFEACIVLLTSTLDQLHAELERRTSGYYQVSGSTHVFCHSPIAMSTNPTCDRMHSASVRYAKTSTQSSAAHYGTPC